MSMSADSKFNFICNNICFEISIRGWYFTRPEALCSKLDDTDSPVCFTVDFDRDFPGRIGGDQLLVVDPGVFLLQSPHEEIDNVFF